LRVESAEVSLQGERDSNQDRVSVALAEQAVLLSACDGMGGHAEGERAAEVAQRTLVDRFSHTPQPLLDPLGFLHLGLGAAHDALVTLGAQLPVEMRPRSTCAICLVQEGSAFWAHVGDSRVYHVRAGRVLERTRDHSHVELLVREGLISAGQMQSHPLRNFVESCLGGDSILPEMTLSARKPLMRGDVLLVCTDGFWSGLEDEFIGGAFGTAETSLRDALRSLASQALKNSGDASDNTSAAALRFLD
jgi:PPM family protein phosphatase